MANALTQLSDLIAAAVDAAGQSVVAVHGRKRLAASGIAWSADLVVTADHVIEREDDLAITTPAGERKAVTIAGRDSGADLAVLRVAGGALSPIARGTAAKAGNLVIAVGRPATADPQASVGFVTSTGGEWRTGTGSRVGGYARTDVTMYPGFSGGPLVDGEGKLLGMNSSMLGRGASIAIPVAALEPLVEALVKHGRLPRGYLGVTTQPVRLGESLRGQLNGQESGLLITAIEGASPAERAGLLVGDTLCTLAGKAIPGARELQGALGAETVDTAVDAVVGRAGSLVTVSVTPVQRG